MYMHSMFAADFVIKVVCWFSFYLIRTHHIMAEREKKHENQIITTWSWSIKMIARRVQHVGIVSHWKMDG